MTSPASLRELRFALRGLRRAPVFTAVAGLTLALGIGANTVIFSLVNAVLLRPLPVADPDRLARIGATDRGEGFFAFSYVEYAELRESVPAFSGVLAHQPNTVILSVAGEPAREMMELVSGNYFSVLGVRPVLGRAFTAEDDRVPGAHPVLVISHRLWRARFGGDAAIVGRQVRLNGHPFTIIGVAPAGFSGTFVGFRIDLWVPTMMLEQAMPNSGTLEQRQDRFLMLIGRLEPGGSLEQAASQLEGLASRWAGLEPESGDRRGITVAPAGGVHPFLGRMVAPFLGLLMGMVGVVLLIVCANVANLMLARVAARQRELAVCAALGAGRWRLARPILFEGLLVATLGAGLGVLLALWAKDVLSAFRPSVGIPLALDVTIDARVLLFTFAVTVVTGLAFSLVPALRHASARVAEGLKESAQSGSSGRTRLRSALVIAQVALSALLLFGAALLLRSLRSSRVADPGFDARGIHVLSADPSLLHYDETRGRALWFGLLEGARALPGVEAAAVALFVPLGDRSDALIVRAADADPAADAGNPPLHDYNIVSAGFFEALRIPFLAGRDFDTRNVAGGEQSAVINQAMARRLWGSDDVVGRRLRVSERSDARPNDRFLTVAGVVRDMKYRTLGEPARPLLFLPFTQWYRPDMVLHVRVSGDAGPALSALAATVRAVEPDLAVEIGSMSEAMGFSLIPLRLASSVLGFAGTAGLLLASMGVFGVVAYTTVRRRREIAIRMALGARRGEVRWLVVRGGIRLTAVGLVLGLTAAALLAQLLRGLLFGVTPADPTAMLAVALTFFAVSAAASFLPARRASALDPASVLREE